MNRKVDLVFEGGGVKGIGLVGALHELEEQGYIVANRAGASAGAIVAALHAAGYSAKELYDILFQVSFESFKDKGWEDRIPLVGPLVSIVKDQGIYEGEFFERWMKQLLDERNVKTFADLHQNDPRFPYKVNVIISDITARTMLVLPQDAHVLGIDPEELSVAHAVRMSMSIPVFFEPVHVRDSSRALHTIVDGGMLSNFPVWYFDVDGKPSYPTFGLMLVEEDPKAPVHLPDPETTHGPIEQTIQFLKDIVNTMVEGRDRYYLEHDTFVRTIPIPTLGVGTTDFGLKDDKKKALFESGVQAAKKFLETWNFEEYVAAFRSGKPRVSRRDLIRGQLRARGVQSSARDA
ncbi:MAG: patatin-like phospholipase family protein [Actinomycetota bacterium]